RKRFVVSAFLLSVAVVLGCSSTCPQERPILDRLRPNRHQECCPNMGGTPMVEGPVLSEGDSTVVLPPAQTQPNCPTPQNTVPPLGPAPRLVPQPTQQPQAQPRPFIPQ